MNESRNAVVAGVDGSDESMAAARAAAWEAEARGLPLRLIHGYSELYPYTSFGWVPYEPFGDDLREGAKALLASVGERLAETYPKLAIESRLIFGSGASALVDASSEAKLVVVGARGQGGFGGLSLGSVAA